MNKLIIIALTLGIAACSSDSNDENTEVQQADGEQMQEPMMESDYECGNSDHPSVGQMAILSTLSHEVAGQVLIKDNCTLEVSSFTYDGGGPSVFFYGGIDGNYTAQGFAIGPMLNGTVYNNDNLTITLESPAQLDQMNGVSVWCADFSVSFGDGLFM